MRTHHRTYSYFIFTGERDENKQLINPEKEIGPFESFNQAHNAAMLYIKQYAQSLSSEGYLIKKHKLCVFNPNTENMKDPKYLHISVGESIQPCSEFDIPETKTLV